MKSNPPLPVYHVLKYEFDFHKQRVVEIRVWEWKKETGCSFLKEYQEQRHRGEKALGHYGGHQLVQLIRKKLC